MTHSCVVYRILTGGRGGRGRGSRGSGSSGRGRGSSGRGGEEQRERQKVERQKPEEIFQEGLVTGGKWLKITEVSSLYILNEIHRSQLNTWYIEEKNGENLQQSATEMANIHRSQLALYSKKKFTEVS